MDNEPNKAFSNDELEARDLEHEPLLEDMDFEITPELVEIISALKVALAEEEFDPDVLRQLWAEYALHFEGFAEQIDSPEVYTKVQIGAILHKAFIFRDAGKELRYLEELNKAEAYAAANIKFNKLSIALAAEIDTKTAELEPSPERLILQLRGKLRDINQVYLWDLWADEQNYEDLVKHVYEMLLEEGEDPDKVLGELGILKL